MVFGRSGIVLQRWTRRFVTIQWSELRGLDIQAPTLVTSILLDSRRDVRGGSLVDLYLDSGTCRLFVRGTDPRELKDLLASWAVREAGGHRPSPAVPRSEEVGPADHDQLVDMALGAWRAVDLGREPVRDRNDLAHRLAVAENSCRLGRFAEAVALLKLLAVETERRFGRLGVETVTVRNALGQAYMDAGDIEDGLRELREVLSLALEADGPDGDLTLVVRNNLAMANSRAGSYQSAIELHKENLDYSEQKLGSCHIKTVARRNNLAADYALSGRRDQAIDLYWQVLGCLREVNPDHDLAVTARRNLAILHKPPQPSENDVGH